ncbi:DUF2752 domain-containing protein [Flavobacterium sp.]|uniref:DUF2752 domain-containing protein n=1 Tax=Flavobacterium sp. TaxID=239 RepID=UPI00286C2276|nr:DUF2752 domain-containing protein [Flavobacterium sp.]
MSKTLFGVECLGCGMQRAFLLLLQGEFIAAFKMYPAIYTTLLFLVMVCIQLLDKNKNYRKLIINLAIINGIFMITGYFYKHFL